MKPKAIERTLVEKVGEHEMVKVDIDVWCIPGCEGAMVTDINKALDHSIFVTDWGITVTGRYPDGAERMICP